MGCFVLGLAAGFGTHPVRVGAAPAGASAQSTRCVFSTPLELSEFLKGNLHTHTSASDGDSPAEDVIFWYRQHGYQFLALTDHNRLLPISRFAALQDSTFQLVPGEEVSAIGGGKQVHVNGLCLERAIPGGVFPSALEALRVTVQAVRSQGGVAIVNHPNFDDALDAESLNGGQEAPLLEIMSGHPHVFSHGRAARPGHEALWDQLLSRGFPVFGVAVDDVHHLQTSAEPPAFPGKAWVAVAARENRAAALCSALLQGRFYASTGVRLRRIAISAQVYTVWPEDPEAQVVFVTATGAQPARSARTGAVRYTLQPGDGYVRARVLDAGGAVAWTPPAFVRCEP